MERSETDYMLFDIVANFGLSDVDFSLSENFTSDEKELQTRLFKTIKLIIAYGS